MPLKVSRFCISALLFAAPMAAVSLAQDTPTNPQTNNVSASTVRPPTSSEVMRDRISKAKAFIAVRNYNAAIYELENIRRETSDQSVQAVTAVLLMNSYLEQRDYRRAQDLLTQQFNQQKTAKPGAAEIYGAVAGQVVKGARSTAERYRSLGLSVGDRTLPLEAVNDIEQMRNTLELVITQAKENGKEKSKADVSMALLEEAAASRGALARDDYDARRWNDERQDSREHIASSRSVITNAVDVAIEGQAAAADRTVPASGSPSQPQSSTSGPEAPLVTKIVDSRPLNQPATPAARQAENPVTDSPAPTPNVVREDQRKADETQQRTAEPPKAIVVQSAPPNNSTPVKEAKETDKPISADGPLDVGSLLSYATRQAPPVYPPQAKSLRTSGVVRVEVMIDENGDVAEVQKATGPTLLQAAAKDAIRKWRFKPFMRDGQPVRAVGFVNFSFTL
ncbi:MAG TPA: TonB family protein [Pyrinomonadaceae bacterium]|nr:TonB family protein [Pyrinomonadaceae bacterium]